MHNDVFLSIVIPVYNESNRVHLCIQALTEYLPTLGFETEVVFVDDGSPDNTVAKIRELSPTFKYDIVSYTPNRGKGEAVRQGMLHAKGAYRLFMDADMSTPINELEKFLPYMNNGSDVIIGSRKTKGAHILKSQPLWRKKLGEVFTLMSNVLLVPGVTDFTCGFKVFSKTAAETIFTRQKIERWGFDAEILFIAAKHGFKIIEVPVNWINDAGTKVELKKDVLRSLNDLYQIRRNNFNHRYD